MFAKLFENPPGRQILVVLKIDGEETPGVVMSVEPPGLGVCDQAFRFKDTPDGIREAEKLFERFTEDMAVEVADKLCRELASFATDAECN